jgi:hypothetical protein
VVAGEQLTPLVDLPAVDVAALLTASLAEDERWSPRPSAWAVR